MSIVNLPFFLSYTWVFLKARTLSADVSSLSGPDMGHWTYDRGVISSKPATSKAPLVNGQSFVNVPWLNQVFKYFYVIKL